MIEKGSNEIDKLLSRAASIVGAPRSVFNLDEKGQIHVDTEKRKDRRYIRKILLGQKRTAQLVAQDIKAWRKWNGLDDKPVTVTFASPFDLTQEESVALMREMNPEALMVSQAEAVKQVWKGMKPDDRDALLSEIEDERQLNEPPPNSALNQIPAVEL